MSVKKLLNNILPIKIRQKLVLERCKYRKRMTYKQIEKFTDGLYENVTGRRIDWDCPRSYTEKICVSKIYGNTKIKSQLTDKVSVREWVSKKIGDKYLVPILGIYDKFSDINFEDLPEQFVIKCNHDSGSSKVIGSKKKLSAKDFSIMKRDYNFFVKRNYAYCSFEMHYKDIPPKIIVEACLGDNVKDYKFLCFNGKPYYCWVDFDRVSNHKRNIYDMNWNLQPFNQMLYGNYEGDCPKPESFDEMVYIVSKLCKGFPHVRVDLYNVGGDIYFGEMTFTNGSGFELINPKEWDNRLGDLWFFDEENERRRSKL